MKVEHYWTDKAKKKAIQVSISLTNLAFLQWLKSQARYNSYSYQINMLLDMYRSEYFVKGQMSDTDKESILNAEKFLNHINLSKAETAQERFEINTKFRNEMTFFKLNKSLIDPEKRELMKLLLDIYEEDSKKEKKN